MVVDALPDPAGRATDVTRVSSTDLVEHLRRHAVRTDGPFTLRSGEVSEWYVDARQTTFDGQGAILAGSAVLVALDPLVVACGGLTMGADPLAVAAAVLAASGGRDLRAFSIRKSGKDHGVGGRLVGPVRPGDVVALLDDTVTTGGALFEALAVARHEGLVVRQALALVDRSGGGVASRMADEGIPYAGLVTPADLGLA